MKTNRLFELLYILLENKNKVFTAEALAERFGVSTRTIYRDMVALSDCGIPVYTSVGKNGGMGLMPRFTMDRMLLSTKEQDELLAALQSFSATAPEALPLAEKLNAIFQRPNRPWLEVDFSRWGHNGTDAERFDCIRRGILEQQLLQITYCDAEGKHTERRVAPLRLVFKTQSWYLQGYCRLAGDFRTFKVNRIVSLTLCEEHFVDNFGPLPAVDDATGDPPLQVKLRASSAMAHRAYDEFDAALLTALPDGGVQIDAALPPGRWVYSYLAGFGGDLEILEPPTLKDEMLVFLQNAVRALQK